MDTSATYIKMCRTPEIQAPPPRFGDLWAYVGAMPGYKWGMQTPQLEWIRDNEDAEPDFYYDDTIERVWLPRQDQLQAMVKSVTSWSLLWHFTDWAKVTGMKGYLPEETSMEQLWLAFVMSQKGKTWNGEEWLA